jgi:outer membrane protein OmpA-like peptidoglycan-associated protein
MKRICYGVFLLIFLSASVGISCNTSRKAKGAVIGATVGGATGAILSKDNRAVGIILGAAIGGVAGGLIGSYMDKQARDIADDLGKDATVTRVGEGIVVSFDSGLFFDFDSDALRSETKSNLQKLATSLKEYKKTEVNVLGHTDSKGSSAYNKTLSTQRATSVENYLSTQGVPTTRVHPMGYGESDPVADNDTESGRQLNRRVEIVIIANDELKRTAKDGSMQ